jgi:hypothetical protein
MPLLLGRGVKQGKNQVQIALAAWEDGKAAFNTYVDLANKSMGLELKKLEPIP